MSVFHLTDQLCHRSHGTVNTPAALDPAPRQRPDRCSGASEKISQRENKEKNLVTGKCSADKENHMLTGNNSFSKTR